MRKECPILRDLASAELHAGAGQPAGLGRTIDEGRRDPTGAETPLQETCGPVGFEARIAPIEIGRAAAVDPRFNEVAPIVNEHGVTPRALESEPVERDLAQPGLVIGALLAGNNDRVEVAREVMDSHHSIDKEVGVHAHAGLRYPTFGRRAPRGPVIPDRLTACVCMSFNRRDIHPGPSAQCIEDEALVDHSLVPAVRMLSHDFRPCIWPVRTPERGPAHPCLVGQRVAEVPQDCCRGHVNTLPDRDGTPGMDDRSGGVLRTLRPSVRTPKENLRDRSVLHVALSPRAAVRRVVAAGREHRNVLDLVRLTPTVWLLRFAVVNAYVIRTTEGVAVLDTGPSGAHGDVLAAVADVGATAADVRWIVLTHCHKDHVGSAAALAEMTGAVVLAGVKDASVIAGLSPEPEASITPQERPFYDRLASTVPPARHVKV